MQRLKAILRNPKKQNFDKILVQIQRGEMTMNLFIFIFYF